jgi:hypothetical protein
MGGRLQRGGGQAATEIWFVEADDAESRGRGIVTQPAERELVGRGEQYDDVGRGVPVTKDGGFRKGEVECGMYRLTRLGRGR